MEPIIRIEICFKHKHVHLFLKSRLLFWLNCFVRKLTVVTIWIIFMGNYLIRVPKILPKCLHGVIYLCQLKFLFLGNFRINWWFWLRHVLTCRLWRRNRYVALNTIDVTLWILNTVLFVTFPPYAHLSDGSDLVESTTNIWKKEEK